MSFKKQGLGKKILTFVTASLPVIGIFSLPIISIFSQQYSDQDINNNQNNSNNIPDYHVQANERYNLIANQTYNFLASIDHYNDLKLNKQQLVDNLNKANIIPDNSVVNVEFIEVDGYTPIKLGLKIIFSEPMSTYISQFKPTSDPCAIISDSTFDTKINSQNVTDYQYATQKQLTLFYKRPINVHPRAINNEIYETELLDKYEDTKFKYPGWNCNYETNNPYVPHGYLNYDGEKVDVMKEVFLERTPDNTTYDDPNWIRQQINNNTFKKHPAALNFYERNVSDTTLAVDTKFSLSTSLSGIIPLGLYAPAGEVCEIMFDSNFVKIAKANNFRMRIIINENYWEQWSGWNPSSQTVNRGDSGCISNRYPYIQSEFVFNINEIDHNNPIYKFGTPFGGSISISFDSPYRPVDYLTQGDNITFQINNAVEQLTYIDGYTTKEDWDQQVQALLAGKISAPIITIISGLYGANIPFSNTGNYSVGSINIKDARYPGVACKKWSDFLYLSNFFASKDLSTRGFRLNMKFCDDVWGNAGAWGGGGIFYCPIGWGADAFFSYSDPLMFSRWGMMHEINHNFEQNNAFWQPKSHGDTNTVNIFDMTVISDTGRFRSEFNINDDQTSKSIYNNPNGSGWTILASPFNIARAIQSASSNKGSISEWTFLGSIAHTVGSKLFVDCVRDNVANFSNHSPGWTGIKEIAWLSKYFKYNFWSVCKNLPTLRVGNPQHSPWHYEDEQTLEEREICAQLDKTYPSFDLIGNLYASGQYLWDKDKQDYVYTTDTTTAYQIPAFSDYKFNFDKYIACANPNFTWENIEFSPTTKLGGKLIIDPENQKNLIYTPNKNKLSEIDEFDVIIRPSNFADKPQNYVPGYKWKIKVRQVVNKPLVYNYKTFSNQSNDDVDYYFAELDKATPWSVNPIFNQNKLSIFPTNKKAGTKICFNFVAPQDAEYTFELKWDDAVRLKINDKLIYQKNTLSPNWTSIPKTFTLKKNDVIKVEASCINMGGDGYLKIQIKQHNKITNKIRTLNISNHAVAPQVDLSNTSTSVINQYLHSVKYQYKNREVDYSLFGSISPTLIQDYGHYVDPSTYKNWWFYKNHWQTVGFNEKIEGWKESIDPDTGERCAAATSHVEFDKPTTVGAFVVSSTGHWNRFASKFRLELFFANGTSTKTGLISGLKNCVDGLLVSLPEQYDGVVRIKLESICYNNIDNSFGVSIHPPKIIHEKILLPSNSFGINNPYIKLNGYWTYKLNDEENLSNINNTYLKSSEWNDTLEFNLKNAEEFRIVGRKSPTDGEFDVYINGEYKFNVSCYSETLQMNKTLFRYKNSSKKDINIKIVSKSYKPIYLNQIDTFGKNVHIF